MRHRVAGRNLGRPTDERIALFRSLVTSLFRYGKISTTEMKAKEIRPIAERMITLARGGELNARRQVLGYLYDEDVARKLFDEIAPRYKDRTGGYTRILKTGFRRGDAASMAIIELV